MGGQGPRPLGGGRGGQAGQTGPWELGVEGSFGGRPPAPWHLPHSGQLRWPAPRGSRHPRSGPFFFSFSLPRPSSRAAVAPSSRLALVRMTLCRWYLCGSSLASS